jgi:uncharacterized protein involved in cysteine biosynthesis
VLQHVAQLVTRLITWLIAPLVTQLVAPLIVDYFASRRLVVDYFDYAARPGASARRAARHVARRGARHAAPCAAHR